MFELSAPLVLSSTFTQELCRDQARSHGGSVWNGSVAWYANRAGFGVEHWCRARNSVPYYCATISRLGDAKNVNSKRKNGCRSKSCIEIQFIERNAPPWTPVTLINSSAGVAKIKCVLACANRYKKYEKSCYVKLIDPPLPTQYEDQV